MIKDIYSEDYTYEDGIKKPIILPEDEIPSYAQFKYWHEKEKDIGKEIKARQGNKEYENNHRPLLGKSNKYISGPGSRYQFDATVADVYLVSSFNRNWIIGRPVVYIAMDEFSRLITGLYIGLEGPSWLGSMMALANTIMNKAQLCEKFEIEISEKDWPAQHLPGAILADRGEMEGSLVETLINSLNIKIENTPPYRADWKGIVERFFRTINTNVKPLLPGDVPDFRKRGGRDYRLDAKLDIYQFTQIILKCVLHHNTTWKDKYIRDEMMISKDVPPIPLELWDYGIKNCSGVLRKFDEDIVKLNLMPRAKATVTEKGIQFKSVLSYSCEKAVQEKWYETARNTKSWKLNVSYDPRNLNHIYLRDEDGRGFEKCYLLETEANEKYFNKNLEEIEYLVKKQKQEKKNQTQNTLQSGCNLLNDVQHIKSQAEKMTEREKYEHQSKKSILSGIKSNRKFEKVANRQNEAFELDRDEEFKKGEVIQNKNHEEECFSPNNLDLLRKKQKENKSNGKEQQ